MSLFAYLAGTDRAYAVRLGNMGLTERADGTQGFGGIIFDDPDKTLVVRGWMKVLVLETACTSAPYIGSGYIGPRRLTRSNGVATYKTGDGRFIDCDIVDENVLLDIRLITDSDGKRPAETHADRINWLLASKYLDQGTDLVDDTSLVDLSNPRPFEEADYRKQYPSNVLEDIDSALARTSFMYTLGTNGQRGMFFDFPDQAVGICTLSISNDLADISLDADGEITGDVYPPVVDPVQTLDPSEVYAKVLYEYRHGTVTANNATTFSTFFQDNSLGYRGVAVTNTRIGLESTARLFADNYLTAHSVEKETITVGVLLPKEKAGLIRAGQFINVKFGHFDNFSGSYKQMRITERVIAHADQTNEKYLLMLELSNRPVSATGPSGGAPGPGDFPHPPPAVGGIVQQVSGRGTLVMPSPITDGDTLIFVEHSRGGTVWNYAAAGYTLSALGETQDPQFGTHRTLVAYKTASSESQTLSISSSDVGGTWYELAGAWTEDTSDENHANAGLGVTFTAGPITVAANNITFATASSGTTGGWDAIAGTITHTPSAGWVEDFDTFMASGGPSSWNGHYAAPAGSLTAQTVSSFAMDPSDRPAWTMQIVSFVSADLSSTDPPLSGQWVYDEVVTMVGAVGTTLFGYALGSLIVKVDGVTISRASYTETDPAAGTFTLSWVPDTDETVTVSYQGI